MRSRIGPALLAVAVLAAVGLALVQRSSSAKSPVGPPAVAAGSSAWDEETPSTRLPTNHPVIPHGDTKSSLTTANAPPALLWDVPAGWEAVASSSTMRLATYRIPSTKKGRRDVELTVTRAGGTTAANLERWVGQFDGAGPDSRAERRVGGLLVTTLEVSGTYEGGMTMGGTEEAQPSSSLLGAVVETGAPFYFFKLVGPSESVREAKPAFEALLASLRKPS